MVNNGNWKNYLIKIIVPGTGGNDYVATGYPFRENRILTARHAIEKPNIDTSRPWRFLWMNIHHEEQPIEKTSDTPTIVTSNRDLDWAVIQLDFQDAPFNPVGFRPDALSADCFVQSEGFPACRHTNASQPQIGMMGASHAKADGQDFFQIDVTSGYKNPNDSGGLSGSPIFDRTGRTIVGLFVKVPERLAGESIWALASSSMLADPCFNALLSAEQKSPRHATIKQVLSQPAFADPGFRQFLIEACADGCDTEDTERLAAVLDGLTVRDILSNLFRRIKTAQSIDVSKVVDFCNVLLPGFANTDDKEWIEQYLQGDRSEAGVKVSAATYEGVERLMAHHDQREMRLKWDGDGEMANRLLKGELCMDFPQAAGGELDPNTRLKKTEAGFYSMFCDPLTRKAQFQRLSDPAQEEDARRQLRKSASEELRYRSEEEGQTHYFVQAPDSDHDLLENLARACPWFLLLHLNNDQKKRNEEVQDFRPLKSLYQLKSDNDK